MRAELTSALESALRALGVEAPASIHLEQPARREHGDFSSNVALTSAKAAVASYPFATIEPNSGIVPVIDKRLDVIAELVKPKKTIPATVEFVDIAGLAQGASRGEGLGNQFLTAIREVDAVVHVIRCFQDSDVQHLGEIDPVRDREIINLELGLADLAIV